MIRRPGKMISYFVDTKEKDTMENGIQFFLPRMRDLKQKIIYHQPEPLVHQYSNNLWLGRRKNNTQKTNKTKPNQKKTTKQKNHHTHSHQFSFFVLGSMLEGKQLLAFLLGEILLSQPVRCKPPTAACPQGQPVATLSSHPGLWMRPRIWCLCAIEMTLEHSEP